MPIIPVKFPEASFTEDQVDVIQVIIMGKVLSFEEEDSVPKLHNSYFQKEAFLITCMDEMAKKWLKVKVHHIVVKKVLKLKVELARIVFRTTKVLVGELKPIR